MRGDWRAHERRRLQRVWSWLARRRPTPTFPQFEESFHQELTRSWHRGRHRLIAPQLFQILSDSLLKLGITIERQERDALLRTYGDTPPPTVVPFPDVRPTLSELRARDFSLGLITNASQPMWLRDETLRAQGLLEFFPDCRLSAADVGYLKPHRAIFARALALLGRRAGEAIFVGDNLLADIHGAQEMGMTAIWRHRPDQELAKETNSLFPIVPDLSIQSLAELLPWLEGCA